MSEFIAQSFRAAGQYDADAVSYDTSIYEFEPSKTVQSEAEAADINTIVRRFGITGELPIAQRVPLNLDFSDGDIDYRTCLDKVRNAEAAFRDLPAPIRSRFDNDAAQFIAFVEDDGNLDEARKLGLIPPAKDPAASGSGGKEGGGGTT